MQGMVRRRRNQTADWFTMGREEDLDSCSSSSIGKNSDVSGGSSEEEDDTEVPSSYKGPLDTMHDLEEVLPIRVGISKFYSGKSKSFTSLADASSISTIEDLAKPENPYNRKRKSLLTQSSRPLRNNASGIPKKHIDFSQSALILGATMRKSKENFNLISSPSGCLPPQHPQTKVLPRNASSSSSSLPPQQNPPWRSFSLSDLQCVVGTDPVE